MKQSDCSKKRAVNNRNECETQMPKGKVKWFDPHKGFGFIIPNEGEDDIFVHYSGIKGGEDEFKTLHDDDVVEYDVEEGDKGPIAVNVEVTEPASQSGYSYNPESLW